MAVASAHSLLTLKRKRAACNGLRILLIRKRIQFGVGVFDTSP
jgi:hypothetical protein